MADQVARIVEQWGEQAPALDVSPLLVLGRVQRVAALADTALRPRFAAAGLAPGDFDLLAALRRGGGALGQGDLAAAMLVTAGAVTKRVDRLAAAGVVERGRAEHDSRARVVTLTAAGRDLTDELMAGHMAAEARLLSGLNGDERESLAGLLARLLSEVERLHQMEVTPPALGQQ